MPLVRVTLEIEFKTYSDQAARATITRSLNQVRNLIEYGAGSGLPTEVIHGSVKVDKVREEINGDG